MQNVTVSDSSLKNREKATLSFNFKEKLEIAKRLSDLNTDVLELGPISSDKADEVLIKTVAACVKKSKIAVYGGETEESIKKAVDLVSGAKNKRIILEIPVSPVYMEYAKSKKPKAVLEQLEKLTVKAASLIGDVEVSLYDATRAEPEFLYTAVKTAIVSGAKTISLIDLAGTMLYCEFYEFIENIFKNVPELSGVDLTVSCSDKYSLGVSNSFAAIEAGAKGVKLSASGAGDLPSIETFVSAIDSIGIKKGFNVSLNKTGLKRILGQINSIAAGNGAANEPSAKEDNEEFKADLTKSEINKLVKSMGYDLGSDDLEAVYSEYLRIAGRKTVTKKDLEVIVASSSLQVPPTFTVDKFSVQSSNVLKATASVALIKGGKTYFGLSYGNGPIDAAFMAIEEIVGMHFELDDFVISSITEGKEAMAETLVKLRYNGKIFSGRGISTDIIGAGIRAYVNAVNKIVYED